MNNQTRHNTELPLSLVELTWWKSTRELLRTCRMENYIWNCSTSSPTKQDAKSCTETGTTTRIRTGQGPDQLAL